MITASLLLVAAWLATSRLSTLPCLSGLELRVRSGARVSHSGSAVVIAFRRLAPEASKHGFPSGFT